MGNMGLGDERIGGERNRMTVAVGGMCSWGYYLKLEHSMLIPLGCKLPERIMRCYSSSL